MKIVEIKQNHLIKKHNNLISATGALSSTAFKMLSMLISMIRTNDTEFQRYALSISSYQKEIGTLNKDSKFYTEQALELMRNPFLLEDGIWFNWCSKVDTKSVEGYIIFDIHQDLKPYLLQLKSNFTQVELTNILNLKGKYSPKLYEYCIMQWNQHIKYKPNSKSYSFDIKLDEFKKLFGVTKSYIFNNIKDRILEKAKTDFKKYTDIQFEYKEQKIGRKVDRLIITIKPNIKKIDKKIVSANDYPIEVMALKGTPNFSNDDDFIIAYDDGSFQLKKANGSYVYFKSLKQFIYMLHNEEF